MDSITLSPNAKINLGLFIKGKRPDGYHLLETVYYPVFLLKDELELSISDQLILEVTGIQLDGNPEDNLCIKAYRALQSLVPDLPPVRIQLTKKIPAGAGLGGGSSDAAHVLSGLNELFDLGRSMDELATLAGKLGADVPFFLYNEPLLAKGIGTEFEAISLLGNFRVELYLTEIHSSTVAAYKALDYTMFDPGRSLSEVLSLPMNEWKDKLDNDLEVPVFDMYPKLRTIKEQFYEKGAFYAAMSGSGSAVFGLFERN